MIGSALALSIVGLLLVTSAWRGPRHARSKLIVALGLWAASTALWVRHLGWEVGIPYAIESAALLALGFILFAAERRPDRIQRARKLAATAPIRFHRLRRFAHVVIAGPLGLFAALGLGLLFATRAPFIEQTRLIIGGLMVPSLWAIMIIYTLMDRRMWRSAAALGSVAIAAFGLTLLAVR
jgi:hypothetical protein